MLRLTFFVAFVANLNFISTADTTASATVEEGPINATTVDRIRIRCGPNQIYDFCPSSCPIRKCKTKDIVFRCLDPLLKPGDVNCPRPRCRCADNYYLTDTNTCVLKEDCPGYNVTCGTNEYYVPCSTVCDEINCGVKEIIACPLFIDESQCVGACRCKPGFFRDIITNKCVTEKECTQCGLNEVPSNCGNNGCLPTCEQPDLNEICDYNPASCKPGCICAKGYVRDYNRVCVPRDKCPIKCKDGEEFSTCPNKICRIKHCDELGFPLPCIRDNNITECGRPLCICKSGLVRNKNGVCVDPKECPSCGGDPNAEPGCGFCRRCHKDRLCPKICRVNSCECRPDYIYDEIKKKCVKPEQCTPICGLNEVPSDCANDICLPNCARPDLDSYCKPNPALCKPGCVCAKGYLRNEKGVCVIKDNCTFECPKNEEFQKCPNQVCRAKTCDEIGYPLSCLQSDRTPVCEKPGCICQAGFVRNKEGICIPVRNCTSCGGDPNAWSGCGVYCDRCSNYKKNETRYCILLCLFNSCECRPGFIFDDILKVCVKPENCYQCGRNEVPSDCATNICLPTCEEPDRPLYCKPNPANCKPGCVCAEGYVRDRNGVCVPKEKCPPKCGPYEIYSECANDPCVTKNCSELGNPMVCKAVATIGTACKGGCVCQPDYLRNEKGVCVPISECGIQCGKNEEYQKCPNQVCRPKTCDDLGYPLGCYDSNRIIECGKPGCICQAGYVRSKEGICIPERNCTSCGGDPNAWSGCGGNCKRCSNYKNETLVCLLSCNLNGCDCRPGFIYDEIINKCVKPENCYQCGRNEVPSDCATNICLPTCEEPDRPLYCKPNPANCKPGCVCAEGYLRNIYGYCIPKEKCTVKPQCGLNEVPSDCATNPCLSTCARPNLSTYCRPNPAVCVPGCVCADNHLRNEKGVCVPRDKCPPKCGPLEVYSDCANAGCDKRNCSQVNQPALCIDVVEGGCIGGCVCQSGHLRTQSGECVPILKCPSNEVCPLPHEYFDLCPSSCPTRQCGIDERLILCKPTEGCNEPSCRCEEGYYRNHQGYCVTLELCFNTNQCGENEVYDTCPSSCPPRTCETKDRLYKCIAPLQPGDPNCPKPTCRCADNYYRNSNGKCVLKGQCPLKCGPNEMPSDCAVNPCAPTCEEPNRPTYCKPGPPVCEPGCVCVDKYIRDRYGKCVLRSNCPGHNILLPVEPVKA